MQRCAVDDDSYSVKAAVHEEPKKEMLEEDISSTTTLKNTNGPKKPTNQEEDGMSTTKSGNIQEPKFHPAKRLSAKWSSGVGARIGCVRDYPMDLQVKALEKVNLSPKLTKGPTRSGSCIPIPSPRPSPRVRMSPRIAYMGLPSPRVSSQTQN